MKYKISKKAAAELTRILRDRDSDEILYNWYGRKATANDDDQASCMSLKARVRWLCADIKLCKEFGIESADLKTLEKSLLDYEDMVDTWRQRNNLS